MKPRSSSTKQKRPSPVKNTAAKTPAATIVSPPADEDPLVKQIRTCNEAISERIIRVHQKHQKVNESLRAIRSQGIRLLGPGSKITHSSKAKLIGLYQTAQRQCQSEHNTLEQLLEYIQRVREIRLKQRMSNKLSRGSLMVLLAQHAASLPLYIGSIEGHPPPLVGAIPKSSGDPIPIGHFVAVFVENVWILGEVKEQISVNKYCIRDVDDDDDDEEGNGGAEKRLTILANRIIPLPHYRADPRRHAHALFQKGAIVLALYPQTTCFYKGIVETPPAGPNDDYLIAFEDSTFPNGYSPTLPVPQLYVVTHRQMPTTHRSTKNKTPSPDLTDETD